VAIPPRASRATAVASLHSGSRGLACSRRKRRRGAARPGGAKGRVAIAAAARCASAFGSRRASAAAPAWGSRPAPARLAVAIRARIPATA
jgi:hypothetical protein